MGLGLSVGMAADLAEHDEEGAEWHREDVAKLNAVLVQAGLAAHQEPMDITPWSTGMYGYFGLHHARRCAAYLQYEGRPPEAAPKQNQKPAYGAMAKRYFLDFDAENSNAPVGSLAKPSARRFDHIIVHSDAEGFYVPQRFEQVVIADEQAYGWIGSSYALKDEYARIAEALQIPPELMADCEHPAFDEAVQRAEGKAPLLQRLFAKPKAPAPWEVHAIAAMSCARMHAAAARSIETGALLVFC